VRSPRPTTTISGELVDTFCYAQSHISGPEHAECAMKCIRKGVPAGIVDEKTQRLYVLLPWADASKLPEALIDRAGHRVTIEGQLLEENGTTFLTVKAFR